MVIHFWITLEPFFKFVAFFCSLQWNGKRMVPHSSGRKRTGSVCRSDVNISESSPTARTNLLRGSRGRIPEGLPSFRCWCHCDSSHRILGYRRRLDHVQSGFGQQHSQRGEIVHCFKQTRWRCRERNRMDAARCVYPTSGPHARISHSWIFCVLSVFLVVMFYARRTTKEIQGQTRWRSSQEKDLRTLWWRSSDFPTCPLWGFTSICNLATCSDVMQLYFFL